MNQIYVSKPHYEVLDGLRGVAAMLVVAFHLFETYSGDHFHQIINHGYLAVDFFFVLSGFVIGYAYDDRWGSMTVVDFFKRRIVRLHPMLIVGTTIGALLFYFSAGEASPNVSSTPWWQLILTMLLCWTLLPLPVRWDCRGWGETNPLNGPAWSLQWEYVANILYALVFRRCRTWFLAVCVAVFGVLTVLLTMNIDLFGLLAERSRQAYTVIGGWSLTPTQLYVGASRLLYPFFAGLLLSRLGGSIKLKNGFLWCSVAVAAVMCMPYIGTPESQWMNGLYECICILALFPLIVAMGAGSSTKGAKSAALCKFLGDISYPLYISHHSLIYIHYAWVRANSDAPLGTHIFVSVALYILAVAMAYACMKLLDMPIRKWLTEHWLNRKRTTLNV